MQDGIIRGTNRAVIRVTPTLTAGSYSSNDVLCTTTEIPNAVLIKGGCSKLLGVTLLNESDAPNDIDLVFMQVDKDLGTINEPVGSGSLWTNALAKEAKVLGVMQIDHSDGDVDLINNLVWSSFKSGPSEANSGNNLPMLLQAESDSTSVYFGAVSRGGPTTAADDYEFIFHIEY